MSPKEIVQEFFQKMKQTEEYQKVLKEQTNIVGDTKSDYEDQLVYNFRANQFFYTSSDEIDWVISMDEEYTTWKLFESDWWKKEHKKE